jgi:hypothetical protein
VITRPDEVNSQFSPVEALASILIETLLPTASFICDAIVRIQISSYSRYSAPLSPVCAGVWKCSPAGRIASCASWAFFTFEV